MEAMKVGIIVRQRELCITSVAHPWDDEQIENVAGRYSFKKLMLIFVVALLSVLSVNALT